MTPQNCPVCGAGAVVMSNGVFWITCGGNDCLEGPSAATYDLAIAAWNRLRYVKEGEADARI